MGSFQSGQMGRTVNPLSFDFGGSNPPLPTVLSFKIQDRENHILIFEFKIAEVAHLVER